MTPQHLMLVAVPDDHALNVAVAGLPGGCVYGMVEIRPTDWQMPADEVTRQILQPLALMVTARSGEVPPS